MGKYRKFIAWSLITGGVIIMTLLVAFFFYGRWEQNRLLALSNQPINVSASTEVYTSTPLQTEDILYKDINPAPAVYTMKPIYGDMVGKMIIPEIKLQVAVLEGTTQSILAKAPGHLNTSVLPGEIGTSIIAAHNVTTFNQIGDLKFGDEFTMTTQAGDLRFRVISSEIVKVGSDILDTTYPSLILETCYPFDDLSLTNQRYLVHAVLMQK